MAPSSLFRTSRDLLRPVMGLLLVGVGLVIGGADVGTEEGGTIRSGAQLDAYQSHYLVFGTRDASGTPRLLAIDFNRMQEGPERVSYEYKLFVAEGGDWSMPVYETWEASPSEAPFPARGGLTPVRGTDGTLRAVRAQTSDLRLEVRPGESTFPFPTDAPESDNRTGHPTFTVTWNGTTYEGPGVYEWIESDAAPDPDHPTRDRQLNEEATFGLYDWIVLYDDEGRLWHVSQGTLTADFAYQRANGTRPIYVQATAVGSGIVRGEEQQFFGMVEHIRD